MWIRRYASILLGLALLNGCGKPVNLPKFYPVKGSVTSEGQPIRSGRLELKSNPDNPDLTITAFIDSHGNFEVVSLDRDGKQRVGTREGNYRVTYVPQSHERETTTIELPKTYAVEAKENHWTIELPEKK